MWSFINSCIQRGDYDDVRWSVDKGIRTLLHLKSDVNEVDETCDMAALHIAVEANQSRLVRMLLAAGANPNANPVFTALSAAVYANNILIARILIEGGADVNLANENDGRMPLFDAIERKQDKMVEFLISAGANVNECTPLHENRFRLQKC